MVNLVQNSKNRKDVYNHKKEKYSFVEQRKGNLLNPHYSVQGRNSTKPSKKQTSLGNKIKSSADNSEAQELKKFIELEDYCRRTTSNSKKSVKAVEKPKKSLKGKKKKTSKK
jgi:hypothetical protein